MCTCSVVLYLLGCAGLHHWEGQVSYGDLGTIDDHALRDRLIWFVCHTIFFVR